MSIVTLKSLILGWGARLWLSLQLLDLPHHLSTRYSPSSASTLEFAQVSLLRANLDSVAPLTYTRFPIIPRTSISLVDLLKISSTVEVRESHCSVHCHLFLRPQPHPSSSQDSFCSNFSQSPDCCTISLTSRMGGLSLLMDSRPYSIRSHLCSQPQGVLGEKYLLRISRFSQSIQKRQKQEF